MGHPSGSGTGPQAREPAYVGIWGSARVFSDAGVAKTAFERLYADQFKGIVSWLRREMPDYHEAEDLAQEIFISVWQAMESGRVANPVAYLWKAARNRRSNWYRDRRKVDLYGLDPATFEPRNSKLEGKASPVAGRAMTAAAVNERAEEKRLLSAAIQGLPLGQRRVFLLADVRGLTEAEAARLLKVSRSTVSTQRNRAYQSLRNQLLLADSC